MSVFFEVATLTQPQNGCFYAVLRIDTDKRMDDGVEGIIIALHETYPIAEAEAAHARAALATPAEAEAREERDNG